MTATLAEEYPGCVIWSLFLHPGRTSSLYYPIDGLLDEAKGRVVPLTLVEGGEAHVNYYHPSVGSLRQHLRGQVEAFAAWRERYPKRLHLGGTIALYHDPAEITGWVRKRSEAGGRIYGNAGEFRPLLELLLASREFLWIYAASAAGYVPFSADDRAVWDPIHTELGSLR